MSIELEVSDITNKRYFTEMTKLHYVGVINALPILCQRTLPLHLSLDSAWIFWLWNPGKQLAGIDHTTDLVEVDLHHHFLTSTSK